MDKMALAFSGKCETTELMDDDTVSTETTDQQDPRNYVDTECYNHHEVVIFDEGQELELLSLDIFNLPYDLLNEDQKTELKALLYVKPQTKYYNRCSIEDLTQGEKIEREKLDEIFLGNIQKLFVDYKNKKLDSRHNPFFAKIFNNILARFPTYSVIGGNVLDSMIQQELSKFSNIRRVISPFRKSCEHNVNSLCELEVSFSGWRVKGKGTGNSLNIGVTFFHPMGGISVFISDYFVKKTNATNNFETLRPVKSIFILGHVNKLFDYIYKELQKVVERPQLVAEPSEKKKRTHEASNNNTETVSIRELLDQIPSEIRLKKGNIYHQKSKKCIELDKYITDENNTFYAVSNVFTLCINKETGEVHMKIFYAILFATGTMLEE